MKVRPGFYSIFQSTPLLLHHHLSPPPLRLIHSTRFQANSLDGLRDQGLGDRIDWLFKRVIVRCVISCRFPAPGFGGGIESEEKIVSERISTNRLRENPGDPSPLPGLFRSSDPRDLRNVLAGWRFRVRVVRASERVRELVSFSQFSASSGSRTLPAS